MNHSMENSSRSLLFDARDSDALPASSRGNLSDEMGKQMRIAIKISILAPERIQR
jgi:hypothetical protein